MSLIIRKAVPSDAQDILDITLDAFDKYSRDLGLPLKVDALHESIPNILNDLETKQVFIGIHNDQALGTIRYEALPGNIAYISRFGVRQADQKLGMGRALVEDVIDDCKAKGYNAIALHTCAKMHELVRFYYGRGFYIHSTSLERGYVRALFLLELNDTPLDLTYVNQK